MMRSKETDLLLLLSRVEPEPSALKKAQIIINGGIHWHSLIASSIQHGTSNIVYKNLLSLEGAYKAVLDKLNNIRNNTLMGNICKASETDAIISGLNNLGVNVIILKGPVASEIFFGNIGLYPSGDIDILVKVEDLGKIIDYLRRRGYESVEKGFGRFRDYYLKNRYHTQFSNGAFFVEPHWNLFSLYFKTPPDFWWQEYKRQIIGQKEYLLLSPERNILYNTFRLCGIKMFSQLRYLVMIAEIIRYYGTQIDWQKLFAFAKTYNFENTLRVVMRLAKELLDTPIPRGHYEATNPKSRFCYPFFRDMLLKKVQNPQKGRILLSFLRDDTLGFLKIGLDRLFLPREEIMVRYNLPTGSYMIPLYFLIHPFLRLKGRHSSLE